MAMTILEFARGGGVGVETVRYYQRRGLIRDPRPSAIRGGGRRHYDDDDLKRLRFVRSAQRAGFTLQEIGGLISAQTTRAQARGLARARITKIDAQIAQLHAARAWLNELARECDKSDEGPCPIIAAFEG